MTQPHPPRPRRAARRRRTRRGRPDRREQLEWLWLAALGALLLLLPATLFQTDKLEAVQSRGVLEVLTVNGPTTYYEGPNGDQGFEYELARAFAEALGVELKMKVEEHFGTVLPKVAGGKADLAAAGITVTESRKSLVRFSPPYQEIRQQVVYRRGNERPRNVKDLIGRDITIVAGTSFAERLRALKAQYPALEWTEVDDQSPEELLVEVWEGLTEITIADSNLVALVRKYYPELQVAFHIQKPERLAWAFPLSDDDSLYNAAAAFIEKMRSSGELKRLLDRYYGPVTRFSYVNVKVFKRRIETVLPQYQRLFQEAAADYNLDWRLLAAQAYQESMWDPEAVSPTGVRGLMMLTHKTARTLNVDDRVDVEASIRGGALYLRDLIDRVPPQVEEPDRTWMALAAYNVGMGHLEDARVITVQQGGDPNKWTDVRERLPLLANPAWYTKTKHGYARGYEPVEYVRRIRLYYDILVKYDEERRKETEPDALNVDPSAL